MSAKKGRDRRSDPSQTESEQSDEQRSDARPLYHGEMVGVNRAGKEMSG